MVVHLDDLERRLVAVREWDENRGQFCLSLDEAAALVGALRVERDNSDRLAHECERVRSYDGWHHGCYCALCEAVNAHAGVVASRSTGVPT